ncbi:cancer-related nucleoside-triphosphatase homolog [Belonocnema kinseyi]|uniref:cancer-related nucleoside-triphosphatase homolog n=1 Tax=Belonocnema kinseyi TaxID=2817044 RepID=UPI00143D5294|nr:cancer-related nucleoside-triphosphatase homolog [Belonocnema kinseyi]
MATGDASRYTKVLFTGPPGIGKTTICKKLVSLLEKQNYTIDGFYTEEVRDSKKSRIGFDVVSIKNSENRAPLARVADVLTQQQFQKHRVGNYHVFTENFERIALPTLNSKTDIVFIDEIGKMELFSEKFATTIKNLFFGKRNKKCIVATIPPIHKVPQKYLSFFRHFHEDDSCKFIEVTRQNRENLPQEMSTTVSSILRKV